eukprot:scaffold1130_cov195-Pinguiococcus_pyrenoidosus.AAC.60
MTVCGRMAPRCLSVLREKGGLPLCLPQLWSGCQQELLLSARPASRSLPRNICFAPGPQHRHPSALRTT